MKEIENKDAMKVIFRSKRERDEDRNRRRDLNERYGSTNG